MEPRLRGLQRLDSNRGGDPALFQEFLEVQSWQAIKALHRQPVSQIQSPAFPLGFRRRKGRLLFTHLRKEIVPELRSELLFAFPKQIGVEPIRLVAAEVRGEGLAVQRRRQRYSSLAAQRCVQTVRA